MSEVNEICYICSWCLTLTTSKTSLFFGLFFYFPGQSPQVAQQQHSRFAGCARACALDATSQTHCTGHLLEINPDMVYVSSASMPFCSQTSDVFPNQTRTGRSSSGVVGCRWHLCCARLLGGSWDRLCHVGVLFHCLEPMLPTATKLLALWSYLNQRLFEKY